MSKFFINSYAVSIIYYGFLVLYIISLDAFRLVSLDFLSSPNLDVKGFCSSSAIKSICLVSVISIEDLIIASSFRARGAGEMAFESSVMLFLCLPIFLGDSVSTEMRMFSSLFLCHGWIHLESKSFYG